MQESSPPVGLKGQGGLIQLKEPAKRADGKGHLAKETREMTTEISIIHRGIYSKTLSGYLKLSIIPNHVFI